MSKSRDKERKRKLYRELKKEKVFSKFCLCIANAFENPCLWGNRTPKDKFRFYINDILKEYKISEFPSMVKDWTMDDTHIKIQT
jgi:hypothetical protein